MCAQRWTTTARGSGRASALATTSTVRSLFPPSVSPPPRSRIRHASNAVYNFLQYSSTYTLFVWLTLVIAQTLPLGSFTPPSRPYPGVDGQQLAIIALAFLFWLFTGALFAAHTRLVLRNMTTIEEIGMNRMKQRERAALNQHYGFWQWRCVPSSVARCE